MASLIMPLVNGFSDAPSGTVQILQHGTANNSTAVWTDVDGTVSAGTTHTLDANGRIVRYVTERVDCVVKNVANSTIASFTPTTDARTIHVENALFNASGITTLSAGLTLLHTSFGTDDGFVLPASQQDSTEYLLKNIFSSVARDARSISTALGATITYTPDSDYGIHYVSITGASLAFNNPTGDFTPRIGAPLIIFFRNEAGANRTPTWGTSYSGIPATAVANNNTALYMFINTGSSSSPAGEWVSVTGDPVETAA